MIEAAVRARIDAILDAVERAEDVRIVLAVESGSRAWGFASPDSDYDVRFLYVRPVSRYLSLRPGRDVIERPVDALLDIGGWDVRKALGLALRSNAVLLEWLRSPLVYRRDPELASIVAAFADTAARLDHLVHHYIHAARRAWSRDDDAEMPLKSYFYALRPALAVSWIERHRSIPPMDLPTLLAGLPLDRAVRDAIDRLRRLKVDAGEADIIGRQPVLDRFLSEILERVDADRTPIDETALLRRADAAFRLLLDRQDK